MRRNTGALPLRVAVSAAALALAGCAAGLLPPAVNDAERLEQARKQARERDWVNAIDLLKVYIDRNAGSAEVDDAIYLLGMCYLNSKEYASAVGEFERLLRDYPESDSSASASFRLGEAFFGQSRPPDFDQEFTLRALEQWERYRRDYPGHWLAEEAARRIAASRVRLATKLLDTAELYLKLRMVVPARMYFQRVEQEFSDTPLLGDAIIGLARCHALEGRTAEAIAYLKDIELMFAGKPLAERAARERSRVEHMGKVRPPRAAQRIPETPP